MEKEGVRAGSSRSLPHSRTGAEEREAVVGLGWASQGWASWGRALTQQPGRGLQLPCRIHGSLTNGGGRGYDDLGGWGRAQLW